MNKICKTYIKEIKSVFPIKRKQEREYFKKLTLDVENYCDDAGITSMQELYENYGKPYEVASNYFSKLDTEFVMKRVRTTKLLRNGIIIFLILTAILVSFICFHLYQSYLSFKRNEIAMVEQVITVIEEHK